MILKPPLGTKVNQGHPLSKDLVGCWLLNEGGGNTVNDVSGSGHTATMVDDAHVVAGKFGPALDVDGVGDWAVTSTTIGGYNEITMLAWVYPREADDGGYIGIASSGAHGSDDIPGLRFDDTLRLTATIGNETDYRRTNTTNNTITLNTWHQFVMTSNLTQFPNAYINAEVDNASNEGETPPIAITMLEHNFYIGAGVKAAANCIIDHVMVWSRMLSADEIRRLYINPFLMFETQPIDLWVGSTNVGDPPEPTTIPVFMYHYTHH